MRKKKKRTGPEYAYPISNRDRLVDNNSSVVVTNNNIVILNVSGLRGAVRVCADRKKKQQKKRVEDDTQPYEWDMFILLDRQQAEGRRLPQQTAAFPVAFCHFRPFCSGSRDGVLT